MKNARGFRKRYIIGLVLMVVYSLILIQVVQAVSGATGEPGSDTNPLVAQDYVDSKVNENQAKVNELNTSVTTLQNQLKDTQSQLKDAQEQLKEAQEQYKQLQDSSKFQVIKVKAGQELIAGGSTEIILRGGKATAIGSTSGGLSDLISGKDLKTGVLIPLNHLILVPVDDGRGLKAAVDAWVMIKGTYTLK